MHRTTMQEEILDSLFDGVYFVDRERIITFWNKAAERITGYSREEVVGSSCSDGLLEHIDEAGTNVCLAGCPLMACMEEGRNHETLLYLHHREGHRVPVVVRAAPLYGEDGQVVGSMEVFSDATGRRRVLREIQELRSEAYMDGRTGVGNRRFADLALEARFRERREYGIDFGVLLAEAQGLDAVRAVHGEKDGDQALRMTARSLLAASRELDVVCHWQGGRFLVAVANADQGVLEEIGKRMHSFVDSSWFLRGGEEVRVGLSVGGALVRPGDDPAAIVRRAEQGMEVCRSQDLSVCFVP